MNENTSKGYVTDKKSSFELKHVFAKREYKLPATVELVLAVSVLVGTLPDTGTGPSLIQKRRFNLKWHFYIHLVLSSRLLRGSKQLVKSCSLMPFNVSIGELLARVTFVSVQNLAIGCLPRTTFTVHYVEIVLPGLRKLNFFYALLVAITGQRSLNEPKI